MNTHSIQQYAKIVIIVLIIAFLALSQYFNGRRSSYSRLQAGNGLSIGHLLFYCLVGIAYPDYIWLALAIGIVFEFLEYILTRRLSPNNRQYVLRIIGGRFETGFGFNSPTHWLDRLIYGGDYPTDHWWQPKVTDILLNIIGFLIGRWIIYKLAKRS